MTAPLLYYWLFLNISLFYVLIAYGLSLWGGYICWEVDEEEKMQNEALNRHFMMNYGNKEYMDNMRVAGWAPLEGSHADLEIRAKMAQMS